MPRNITARINRMQQRRSGMERWAALDESARISVLAKSLATEAWETRATSSQPYTRYALGAMQEVGPDSTRVSIETAERVGRQLHDGLLAGGRRVAFRLQGSVPLNVHIRGVSDVDLLTLDLGFVTYDTYGVVAQRAGYFASQETSLGRLLSLRAAAEPVLKNAYPKATVDTSGGKAIKLTGGSLARAVDVVPAHWYDTATWQASQREADRAVRILDKSVPMTLDNWPFLHIERVGSRCDQVLGGLRKGIRLAKNVKSDAEGDGTSIKLASFDIAGLIYHADQNALRAGFVHELAVLAEVQRWLDVLYFNTAHAQTLRTPDGSRAILDTPAKVEGLKALSVEFDDLLREVAREQRPSLPADVDLATCRQVVATTYVAGAA